MTQILLFLQPLVFVACLILLSKFDLSMLWAVIPIVLLMYPKTKDDE